MNVAKGGFTICGFVAVDNLTLVKPKATVPLRATIHHGHEAASRRLSHNYAQYDPNSPHKT